MNFAKRFSILVLGSELDELTISVFLTTGVFGVSTSFSTGFATPFTTGSVSLDGLGCR